MTFRSRHTETLEELRRRLPRPKDGKYPPPPTGLALQVLQNFHRERVDNIQRGRKKA